MNKKELIIAITLSIILIAESIWSLNYLKKAKKTGSNLKPSYSFQPPYLQKTSLAELQKAIFTQSASKQKKMPPADGPQLYLSGEKKNFLTGEEFKIKVELDLKNKSVQAIDAVVLFDPTRLTINEIAPSIQNQTIEYPQNRFDNQKGEAKISLIFPQEPLTGGQVVVTEISFTALKAGKTNLSFEFEPGQTNDCNVVLYNETDDSLSKVKNLEISIQ